MAKLSRNGAEYFPLDVYLDDKFKFIEIKYRLEGFAIVIKLYQRIYGFGYWCNWNDEVALLFADELRAGPDLITGVVEECLKRGVFDADLYDRYGILTSLGIQKRYGEIIKRRKETELTPEYILPGSGLTLAESRQRAPRCRQEVPPAEQPDGIQEENADSVDTGSVHDADAVQSGCSPDADTVHAGCSHDVDTVHAGGSHDASTMYAECLHDVDIMHASCEHDVSRSEQTKGNETKGKGKEILKPLVPPPGDVPPKSAKTSRIFGPATFEYKMAQYLLDKIRVLDAKAKQPNLQLWAMDIDKLIRIDKRTPAEVKDLIDFAHDDPFWCKQILSPGNLRNKATKLTVLMKNTPTQGGTPYGGALKPAGKGPQASRTTGFDASQFQYRSEDG